MVISQDEFKKQVKAELREALIYFIERQKLVAQAMTDLGLNLDEVGEFGALAWASNPEADKLSAQDTIKQQIAKANDPRTQKMLQLALRASERALPQSGFWRDSKNNEWKYFLHGGGCRLTNVRTREPIDWDCPDVNAYDKYKFFDHLEWQLTSSEYADKLKLSRSVEKDMLKSLIHEIAL